ncbi:hydroxypyruvate isomerase [Nitrogeniibacter mangrovi]|uniref:Hydroxypyruvate isomerase n=1 Tax=Nitrogeniibacter mangrovi TaxID=2016596 RepID=A0A6C1B1G3_9RHOO|nr:hydroxypyruvate isomerase [Nitrogeniibacter mangrovi]QID16829.1 hydroxypyruvate isomerase [Nitrogeniibacter mangrovi]
MPRFAANISLLFTEHAFAERFDAAARAGFAAVECQFPYDWPLAQLVEARERAGVPLVLHNLPAGDWGGGERGIACHPDRVGEFQDGVGRALEYACALDCPQLNCLAGIAPAGVDPARVRETFVTNLRFAATALAGAGMRLLVEPINSFDVPGFYLNRSAQAFDILDAVGAANLFVQFDLYHAQRMEGELAGTLSRHLSRIGHIQLADNPGRHEPGTGEIRFPFLFDHLDALGYAGWVGCEYVPAGRTEDGLGWRP